MKEYYKQFAYICLCTMSYNTLWLGIAMYISASSYILGFPMVSHGLFYYPIQISLSVDGWMSLAAVFGTFLWWIVSTLWGLNKMHTNLKITLHFVSQNQCAWLFYGFDLDIFLRASLMIKHYPYTKWLGVDQVMSHYHNWWWPKFKNYQLIRSGPI